MANVKTIVRCAAFFVIVVVVHYLCSIFCYANTPNLAHISCSYKPCVCVSLFISIDSVSPSVCICVFRFLSSFTGVLITDMSADETAQQQKKNLARTDLVYPFMSMCLEPLQARHNNRKRKWKQAKQAQTHTYMHVCVLLLLATEVHSQRINRYREMARTLLQHLRTLLEDLMFSNGNDADVVVSLCQWNWNFSFLYNVPYTLLPCSIHNVTRSDSPCVLHILKHREEGG